MKRLVNSLWKSVVSLALCGLLLPACGIQKEPPPTASGTESGYENHLNISVAFWNIQEMAARAQSGADPVQRYVEDLFNITLEPVDVSWSDYEERYNVMVATNSLPDVFATNMMATAGGSLSSSLNALVKKNAIRALPDDLSGYPLVSAALERSQGTQKQLGGRNYTIPRSAFDEDILGSSDAGMLVRKDWMETLGIEDPANFEEFKTMLTRFVNEDPDGNGQADTLGLNVNNRAALGKWVILGIAPECNVFTWVEEQGRLVPSYTLPEFEGVVTAYRSLYQSGALDPDFHVKKANDAIYDFVRGRLGALEYKSSPAALSELVTQWNMYQSQPFEDCIKLLHIFPAPDGRRYSNGSSPAWSESAFSAKVDDDKMNRILALYEFLMSPDGWKLTRLGVEGEDYTVNSSVPADEIGRYQFTEQAARDGAATQLKEKYPSLALFGSLASWGGVWEDFRENDVNLYRYGQGVMHMAYEELLWNVDYTIQVERPYWFFPLLQDGSTKFSSTRIVDDLTQVIVGRDDPVQMWRAVLETYDQDGLQEYIDAKNKEAGALRPKA